MLFNCGVGEDSWEFLDCKEIKVVNPKGNQSWIFIRRTDAEAVTLILWPPDAKSWLICKDTDAGKDWGQEEKGTTEDQMASLTQWTWVSVGSGSWWWTGRPGVLQFMELQRVGHDWATELNWTMWYQVIFLNLLGFIFLIFVSLVLLTNLFWRLKEAHTAVSRVLGN